MKRIYTLIAISFVTLLLNRVNCQVVCKNDSFKDEENQKSTDQTAVSDYKEGYYIIAGAFAIPDNATAFCSHLKEQGYNPSIIVSDSSHKSYVSLDYSQSSEMLKKKLGSIKKTKELKDAWILKLSGKKEMNKSEKVFSESIRASKSKNSYSFKKATYNNLSKTHHHYNLIINVHDDKNQAIPATINIINGEEAKLISKISSNKLTDFNYPKAENQTIKLSCETFGFHKTTFTLNLKNPVNEKTLRTVRKAGDTIIVDMLLEKPKKGDIMTMYHVFFFSNSNAIRQNSNYELQQLLNLLKEKPELEIKIHGHTNGSFLGSFIKTEKGADDLFSTSNCKKTIGTAGSLSRLRSSTIKKYLTSNGIAKNRIKIKGWGGRRMIHKEYSPLAENNIRVEVEVLKD